MRMTDKPTGHAIEQMSKPALDGWMLALKHGAGYALMN